MKRLLSVLVLVLLASTLLANTANADGRRAIVKSANGTPIATLLVCVDPNGGFTGTLVALNGNVICGPSHIARVNGQLAFRCNGFGFFFGCNRLGCFWHVGLRHGRLCRSTS